MGESKHTPGPFKASVYDDDGSFTISPEAHPHVVLCSRPPWPHRAKESAANGHLFGAAPDLLEALKAFEAWNPDFPTLARAAIAKAEGRSLLPEEEKEKTGAE